ncbi:MAG: hypothetical protein RLZZ140_432, partial [Pseudomonadota bacterium]
MISPEEVSALETVVIALGLAIGIGLGWV